MKTLKKNIIRHKKYFKYFNWVFSDDFMFRKKDTFIWMP